MTQSLAMNSLETQRELDRIVSLLLDKARDFGADEAEVDAGYTNGLSTTVRLGETETIEFHRDKGVGITVFFNKAKGSASTSDTTEKALIETVRAACEIAKFTQADPCNGLADRKDLATHIPDLDLYHPWDIDAEAAIEIAKKCEDMGRSLDKRITNSEGASISTTSTMHVYGNSNGFLAGYPTTSHSLSLVLIAKQEDVMQRDYWYTASRYPEGMESLQVIAQKACERTVRRLGARRLVTRKAPVIFSAELATGLLGSFISAISGGSLYRKTSFLVDSLGKNIFPAFMQIREEPHLKRELGSAPFDDEGVVTRARDIIKDGVLQSYVLGSYSARKLGMHTTGNSGGVHNLRIKTGDKDLRALIRAMGTGLLVTELIGHGVNILTGDYSRGASGFWVEDGEIQYPVEEITVAGNLRDMFKNIVEIGNDIERRSSFHTGSWLMAEMMIAGE